jgi:hypothetical protein
MTETQTLQTNRIYSIALMKEDSQWWVYQVKIRGRIQRDFFVETVASRIARSDSITIVSTSASPSFVGQSVITAAVSLRAVPS